MHQREVAVGGLVEALPQCGGYKVHLDKIKRLGVPIWTSHTALRAEGDGKVERVVISEIDSSFQPIPGTEAEFQVTGRKPRAIEDLLNDSDADIDSILQNIEREPLPDWVIEEEETADFVGATLSSLPPVYRDALVAKYVDGWSVAQIGDPGGHVAPERLHLQVGGERLQLRLAAGRARAHGGALLQGQGVPILPGIRM